MVHRCFQHWKRDGLRSNSPEVAARSVRFATVAARHSRNKVLVRPTWRLTNAQLHQACNTMLHDLATSSDFRKGDTEALKRERPLADIVAACCN